MSRALQRVTKITHASPQRFRVPIVGPRPRARQPVRPARDLSLVPYDSAADIHNAREAPATSTSRQRMFAGQVRESPQSRAQNFAVTPPPASAGTHCGVAFASPIGHCVESSQDSAQYPDSGSALAEKHPRAPTSGHSCPPPSSAHAKLYGAQSGLFSQLAG